MKRRKIWLNILCLILFTAGAYAGLHPLHTLVVVNDASPSSQTIGHYYAQQRGIPERNICHLSTTTNYSISAGTFSNQIQNSIFDFIADQGLSNQISTIVLSRDIPYRIYDSNEPSFYANGTPAALFYGYRNAITYPMPAAATSNRYYAKEYPFSSDLFGATNRQYLCFIITANLSDQSLGLIDRTATCDATSPTGTVYLLHTTDAARSVQWPQYDSTVFLNRLFTNPPLQCVEVETNNMAYKTDVMGHYLGQSSVESLSLNTYFPGSLASHLTSFGGCLFDPDTQMSILEWLLYGCAGSYGTCTEPYNYTQKFPDIQMYFWYSRGFSLGECLYMAVQNPYQGVFAGDPLCAPYATPATVECTGIEENGTLSGVVTASVQSVAYDARHPLDRMDIYLDGLFMRTVTNIAPSIGSTISLTIGATTRSVTVVSNDTLFSLAQSVTNKIKQTPSFGVTAKNTGDRVTVVQNTLGISATGIACSAQTAIGSASELTVFAWTTHTHFLESQAAAYEQIYLQGTPTNGDVVRTVITTLAGASITNEVTASNGATTDSLLTTLADQINADTNLQNTAGCCAKYVGTMSATNTECFLTARTNTYEGAALHVDFQVIPVSGSELIYTGFADDFNDNADDLKGKAMLFLAVGKTNLSTSFTLNTATLTDGPHTLTMLAREGTGVGTWSSSTITFRVINTPLRCSIIAPVDYANFQNDETISITVTASSPSTVTGVVLYVEGKKKALTNSVPWNTAISANEYGPGVLTVQAEAMDNTGNRALSDPVQLIIYQDTDADGLPDWWEYQYFGGSTNAIATADTDTDSADNLAEYIASTIPTNTSSVLAAAITHDPASANIVLQWPGSSLRFYNVFYRDELLTSSWSSAESASFRGWNPATSWTNSALTNAHRAYRIQAIIP